MPGTVGSVRSGGVATESTALSANLHWVWRDLDSAILPTRGASLALQTAAGHATQAGGPNGPFARLYGRLTGYLPLWDRWYWLTLMVAIMGAEWALRRRFGYI